MLIAFKDDPLQLTMSRRKVGEVSWTLGLIWTLESVLQSGMITVQLMLHLISLALSHQEL